jgi:hypothetical protein
MDIPQIGFFSGFEIVSRIDAEDGVTITTFAIPQDGELTDLLAAGWIRKAPNVFEYRFSLPPEQLFYHGLGLSDSME